MDSGEVLGHMALFDYPNVRSVDPADWEEWLHDNYQCKKASVSTKIVWQWLGSRYRFLKKIIVPARPYKILYSYLALAPPLTTIS